MSKYLLWHRWHYVVQVENTKYPTIYKFVCDRCGSVKLVEGDLRYE